MIIMVYSGILFQNNTRYIVSHHPTGRASYRFRLRVRSDIYAQPGGTMPLPGHTDGHNLLGLMGKLYATRDPLAGPGLPSLVYRGYHRTEYKVGDRVLTNVETCAEHIRGELNIIKQTRPWVCKACFLW